MCTIIKKILVIVVITLITNVCRTQNIRSRGEMLADYQKCIHKLYDILYHKNPSLDFRNIYKSYEKISNNQIEKYSSNLTYGLSYDSICYIIKNIKDHDEGIVYSEYIILTFPNNNNIYFELNTDTPTIIGKIWLNNGDNLADVINNRQPTKLQWQGIINTKSNKDFIEVHERANISSKISGKLFPNEPFFYSPVGHDWWPVYVKGKLLGYVQKKDIVMFENFPKILKEKLRGC